MPEREREKERERERERERVRERKGEGGEYNSALLRMLFYPMNPEPHTIPIM